MCLYSFVSEHQIIFKLGTKMRFSPKLLVLNVLMCS